MLDPSNRSTQYANAGHVPPLVRSKNGSLEEWPTPSSIPRGALPDARYETGERRQADDQTLPAGMLK